jgi:hypothetical protein
VNAAEAVERKRRFLLGPGLPPMPDDPNACRWCGGQRIELHLAEFGLYCPAGCAANDFAPYLGHCEDCRRDFHTGRRLFTCAWCWECEARHRAANALPWREASEPQTTGFTVDMTRKGANLEAIRLKEERDRDG